MGVSATVLLILLSLISLPKTSRADGKTKLLPKEPSPPSVNTDGPGETPVNWTGSWEQLSSTVSRQCFHHARLLYNHTVAAKTYAQHMMNSTGRPDFSTSPEDRWVNRGSPQQCTVSANQAEDLPPSFRAMYCRVSWSENPQMLDYRHPHEQGVCVPMSCSEKDVARLVEKGLLGVKPISSWKTTDVNCDKEEDDVSIALSIPYWVAGFTFFLLAFAGTSYEFVITVCCKKEKRRSLKASKCGRFLLCFSAYSNTKKVFNTRQLPGQFPVLHGLRVGSALWIIYGHVDGMAGNVGVVTIANRLDYATRTLEWWWFVLNNFDMAVDTFLILSGFLVAYHFMKQLKKGDGEFTWKDLGLHYLHRYWRLTPVYYGLLLVFLPHEKGCQSYWWANLLYINNYFMGEGKNCFGVSWYVALDMQLYIFAPALILLLYKKPTLGIAINVFLVVLSWAFYAGLRQLDHLAAVAGVGGSYFWTPSRMAPYIMGILLANVLFRINCKVPNTRATKVWMLVGWTIGITLGIAAMGTHSIVRAVTTEILLRWNVGWWVAVERTIFAGGVCWLIFACCVGYGGIISAFLSWRAWLPLSRLSYIVYLIHQTFNYSFFSQYKSPLFYSGLTNHIIFIGISAWAFIFSYLISIGLEVPFFGLEKLILPQRRGRQPENGNASPGEATEEPNELLPLNESPSGGTCTKSEDDETDTGHAKNSV